MLTIQVLESIETNIRTEQRAAKMNFLLFFVLIIAAGWSLTYR